MVADRFDANAAERSNPRLSPGPPELQASSTTKASNNGAALKSAHQRLHTVETAMDPTLPPPEITVLLLGDPEVGKSTFLSRLSLGRDPHDDAPPPYSLPQLRDLDQPFRFDITMYRRPYELHFYDTASPTNYTLLKPNFIILCYDISNRDTLYSLRGHWRTLINTHFDYDELLPVMVLGLKRDLRREWTEDEKKDGGRGRSVMPQEGLGLAQELRCDRYAECSAITGELCREVLEDVARTSARTTTEKGGKTDPGCGVM